MALPAARVTRFSVEGAGDLTGVGRIVGDGQGDVAGIGRQSKHVTVRRLL